jgi:small subunit ribosomal protein S16
MATRIRLSRVGRKRQASFRIVVAGGMHATSGRITETIGKYNPRTYPSHIEIDEKRALHWLRQGAKMSESVDSLFRKTGILTKLAAGEEGEGIVTVGDAHGKTIMGDWPTAKKSKKAVKAEAVAAAPTAETAEAEAAAEAPKTEAPEAPKTEAPEAPEIEAPEAAAPEAPVAEAEAAPAEEADAPEAEEEKKDE